MLHVTFHSFVDTCMPHGVVIGCEARRQGVSFSRLCHARVLTSWWRVATPGETGRPRAAEWIGWGRSRGRKPQKCRVGPSVRHERDIHSTPLCWSRGRQAIDRTLSSERPVRRLIPPCFFGSITPFPFCRGIELSHPSARFDSSRVRGEHLK